MPPSRSQRIPTRNEAVDPDAIQPVPLDMQHMTVGQYLDTLLESELDSVRDVAQKCEENFEKEVEKIKAEIMRRAQIKYNEFKARRAQA